MYDECELIRTVSAVVERKTMSIDVVVECHKASRVSVNDELLKKASSVVEVQEKLDVSYPVTWTE